MYNDIHRTIRRYFRATVRDDNMPVCCGKGTRANLPSVWKDLGYKRGVELGVHRGDFSRHLLRQIPECHLWCVDPWHQYEFSVMSEDDQQRYYDRAMEKLTPYVDEGRCTILRTTSMDAVTQFADESLDFVYVDGDHTFDFACTDIIFWSKKLRSGGMMGVHDYCHMRRSGVVKAVDGYTHCHKIEPWYVTREKYPTAFWVKP